MKTTKSKRPARCPHTPCSTTIGAYQRYPDDEIIRCIAELRTGIPAWFAANPSRKICKVALFYGRAIDVRRENWAARLDSEQAKLLSASNSVRRTQTCTTTPNSACPGTMTFSEPDANGMETTLDIGELTMEDIEGAISE